MPAPHEIMPRLEGLAGVLPDSTDLNTQNVLEWVKMAKIVMAQTTVRNLETWRFEVSTDIDETANVIADEACTLYGIIIASTDSGEALRFHARNVSSTYTLDNTAALATTDVFSTLLPAVGATANTEYKCFVFPEGQRFATGITVACEDEDGGDPAGEAPTAYFLYTTDS